LFTTSGPSSTANAPDLFEGRRARTAGRRTIAPSIDPLSDKNRELAAGEIDTILARLGVPRDRPIVTQVSRFDRLKDPVGVIQAFRLARKYNECRLVLAGGGATGDPEGAEVLASVYQAADGDPDIFILDLPPTAHLEINALQRASTSCCKSR